MLGAIVSPDSAMAAIARRPQPWLALAALVGWSGIVAGVWLSQVEPREFVKAQLEEYRFLDRIPPEQQAEALDRGVQGFSRNAWLGILIGSPIVMVAIAGAYLFVFNFFLGAEMDFRQSLAVLCSAFLAVSLVTGPLSLLTLWLKRDWNIQPEAALQASLALLLDRSSASRILYSIGDSLDLFSFWRLYVMAAGYAVAARQSRGAALAAVASLWVVYVLAKVGFLALFL